MKRFAPLMGLALIFVVIGCDVITKESDDVPSTPKVVAFKGDVDPKFVGSWKTAKDSSGLDLHKDGSASITSKVPTPRGVVSSSYEGKWAVSGADLYLQYKDSHQSETTIKYPATLSGNELTLDQGSRSKLTYVRK